MGPSGHTGPGSSMEAGGIGLSPFAVLCPRGSFLPIFPPESTAKPGVLGDPLPCVYRGPSALSLSSEPSGDGCARWYGPPRSRMLPVNEDGGKPMQTSYTFQQPSGPGVATFGVLAAGFSSGEMNAWVSCVGDRMARLCLRGQAPSVWLQ